MSVPYLIDCLYMQALLEQGTQCIISPPPPRFEYARTSKLPVVHVPQLFPTLRNQSPCPAFFIMQISPPSFLLLLQSFLLQQYSRTVLPYRPIFTATGMEKEKHTNKSNIIMKI